MFHHGGIGILGGLVQPPEGQARKEDEGRPDAVVPLGVVYGYLHRYCMLFGRSEILGYLGILEIVHLVHHAYG